MKGSLAQLAQKLIEHRNTTDTGCPPGWLSVHHIKTHLRFLSNYAASSKAKHLCDRGLLVRKAYKVASEFGRITWAYAYKPKKPCRNMDEVMLASKHIGQEKVPRGWVSASTFCELATISRSAVFQMASRHRLETRFFRIRNGINGGIKPVCHFNLASLKRLHHLSS